MNKKQLELKFKIEVIFKRYQNSRTCLKNFYIKNNI